MRLSSIILISLLLPLISCSKSEEVRITYETTGAISAYNLNYLQNDVMNKTTVSPESAQDSWVYSFMGEKGDIVYVSGNYSDINSGLKILIKIDGKVYKQASNQGDTLRYLIVSGVVPY